MDATASGQRMSETEFHHIGLACRDLAAEQRALEIMGYRAESPVYDDPGLGIRCQFLAMPVTAPRIELVAPLASSTVLDPWLDKGVKLYHLAFLTADLAGEIARLQAQRGKIIVPPTPAVAFDGKHVSFVMLPNMLLAEFIEK
jgi:methylmalonyl-CoA/ethylmalonyl-CoA epimerase